LWLSTDEATVRAGTARLAPSPANAISGGEEAMGNLGSFRKLGQDIMEI
jgi:hypothetical protein